MWWPHFFHSWLLREFSFELYLVGQSRSTVFHSYLVHSEMPVIVGSSGSKTIRVSRHEFSSQG